MRVVVAGAGIGGLACAQGLRRAGVDVVVLERDTDPAATGGYRLHLGPTAVQALRSLMTPVGLEALMASSVGARGFALALRDHRGRVLLQIEAQEEGVSLDVDRVTLRLLLADGLGDALRLGVRCTGWELDADTVRVQVADGQQVEADALVIADGAGSPLAQGLAGEATSRPSGFVGVAGRTAWDRVPAAARELLRHMPLLAVGPAGVGLFATLHDPVGCAALRSPLAQPATTAPTVIWGLITGQEQLPRHFPQRMSALGHEELVAAAAQLLDARRWDRRLTGLVEGSDAGSASAYRLHASNPDRLAPWPASRVTALGDAVHAMPPTGGQGAATAVRDAAVLVAHLAAAARGEVTVAVAMSDYEAQMRRHAAPAVRESLQPLGWIRAMSTPAGAAAARAVLPLVAAAAAGARGLRGATR